ncbi:MAG: YicC family protein [Clostridiales bacterium]|nr:YicC family protein [Clostridiales bacterium]MDY2834920.1 YicC/YloC family endoribonuclease [Candidatus Aphodomonas sp.]
MRSMTGYGRGGIERDGRELTLELKTVNHRFLDLNIRLPRALLFLEDGLRKGLNARLSRGHVDVFINYRNVREDAREVTLDGALLKAYARAMDEAALLVPGVKDDRALTRLVSMPDVLTVAERSEDQESVTALCADVLNLACDALEQMREREGESIGRDLAAKVDNLERIAGEIAGRAPGVVKDYQQRLNERIAELLQSPPDPQRLAQEVAIFADRAAIDEELVRLSSHFAQFRHLLAASEPVGRKLDFLVQEMNREVNTIGSKASDLEIGKRVVEAKAEIEKIREQVQNIE